MKGRKETNYLSPRPKVNCSRLNLAGYYIVRSYQRDTVNLTGVLLERRQACSCAKIPHNHRFRVGLVTAWYELCSRDNNFPHVLNRKREKIVLRVKNNRLLEKDDRSTNWWNEGESFANVALSQFCIVFLRLSILGPTFSHGFTSFIFKPSNFPPHRSIRSDPKNLFGWLFTCWDQVLKL